MATKKTEDKNPRLTGTVFILISIALVIGVLIFWQQEQDFQSHALQGEATVVRLHTEMRKSGNSRHEVYLVTYRFILPTPVNGQREVMIEEDVSGGTYLQMKIGQTVTVLYLASDSTHPRLEEGSRNTTSLFIVVFAGGLLAVAALGFGLKKLLIDAPKLAAVESSNMLLGGEGG